MRSLARIASPGGVGRGRAACVRASYKVPESTKRVKQSDQTLRTKPHGSYVNWLLYVSTHKYLRTIGLRANRLMPPPAWSQSHALHCYSLGLAIRLRCHGPTPNWLGSNAHIEIVLS